MATKQKLNPKEDLSQAVNRNRTNDYETLERAKEMEQQRQAKNGLQTVRIDPQTTIIVDSGVSAETARELFISKINECRKKYY